MNLLAYSPQTVAIGFIVLLAIGAIIFMIVMLFRILSETQGGYHMVLERSYEISKAGESLGEVMGALEEILMRLNTLKNSREHEAAPGQPMLSNEAVKSLERLLLTFPSVSMREMEVLIREMHRLLRAIHATDPEAYAEWITENRGAIEKVLEHEGASEQKATEIREVFDETRPLIEHWVLEAKMKEAEIQTPEMQAAMEQQSLLLNQARQRAEEAEGKLQLLRQQVDTLLAQQAKKKSEDKEELEKLREHNAQLSGERASLIRHLDNLSGEIKRTRLEKQFIEDRFVDMDEKSRSSEAVDPVPAV